MDKAWVTAVIARIGEFGKAVRGYRRLAFSDADWAAREYVTGLMREAGLTVRSDAFGNVVGRFPGRDPQAPAVGTGSHVDTVPEGGNYDGVVGTVGGLAAVRRLIARGPLTHPLEFILFMSEESSRFGFATMGSKAMAGSASLSAWMKAKDPDGRDLPSVFAERGLDAAAIATAARRPGELKAFVEMHIEQGPVLEEERLQIGIVEGIAAPTRLKVTVNGVAGHSGATPMGRRQDALVGAAQVVLAVQAAAQREAAHGTVGTVGVLKAHPGAINVIPGMVEMMVDIRGIDSPSIGRAVAEVRAEMARIAEANRTPVSVETIAADQPVPMDPAVVGTIEGACRRLGIRCRRMPSGAGHDAMNMARIAPAGMIFIPCRGGISHNPDEYASPEDILTGVDALTETLYDLAR
jgi:N-carbamoyl-L-amino-acid hydrolase